ncbi:DgyrCDS6867 [Dimorphilus gyrociliatus]|uniref:DgyrCDS6867 n=1 Tax=Dimorphilus gyrociliatus TaxID=2664684 RepID=A0A7I8VRK1_9ANNE|nr:DgyrCDS6867 [Dimorphilus gyrociliatus]
MIRICHKYCKFANYSFYRSELKLTRRQSNCSFYERAYNLITNRLEVNTEEDLTEKGELRTSAELLRNLNYDLYELFECPFVLLLNEDSILQSVAKLEQTKFQRSIPFLWLCHNTPSPSLHSRLKKYTKSMMDYNSNISLWRDKLKLTDSELSGLFINNRRLFQLTKDKIPNKTSIIKKCNKLELLLNDGYELDEIKRHSFVLTNPTVETLEQRLKELEKLNIQPKPPIAWLSQAKSVYESLVNNFRTEEQKMEKISEELNIDLTQLLLLETWNNMSATNYREKLKFFIDKGYSIDQLIDYQRIGLFSLDTIKKSYEELENLGSDFITLEVRF